MIKKSNLFLLAATATLFAVGCQKEAADVDDSSASTVTFTVKADGQNATRAISDGKTCDELVYRVLDKDGNVIPGLAKVTKETSFPTTVSVNLIKGQSYKIVFWAQDKDCGAYTVGDDMKVAVSYEGDNNDEGRDAFFKTIDYTVSGSANVDVTLKRPFAQVNVGTTKEDWDAAVAAGMSVEKSSATLKGLANSLNLVDGTVSGNADAAYALGAIPAEKLTVDGTEYHYLSMSYVLPDQATESSTVEASFVIKSNVDDVTLGEGLSALPVQRNYRTNILGGILTKKIGFTVKIDPIYDGDHTLPIRMDGKFFSTIQSAIDAIAKNGKGDIEIFGGTYNEVLNVTGGKTITLKAAPGMTVTVAGINAQQNGADASTVVAEGITFDNFLSESDSWFTGTGHCAPCVGAWGGSFTFKDCTFKVAGSSKRETGIMTWWTTAPEITFDLEDCKFEGAARGSRAAQYYGNVNVVSKGCEYATDYRYALKFVGKEGNTATFDDSKVTLTKDTDYFVELGSAPYAGKDYSLYLNNTTMTGTSVLYTVANEEGQKVFVDGSMVYPPAYAVDESAKTLKIYSAKGWDYFTKQVNDNKTSYNGWTVSLEADIDFGGATLAPISQTGGGQFTGGVFDGKGHTLSNFVIDESENTSGTHSTGLFGWINTSTVKNLNADGATVTGHHNVGVIAGYMESIPNSAIENCHVTNATVLCSYANRDADGDKCGGIVGYAGNPGTQVKGCTVKDSSINAGRDAGQVAGCSHAEYVTDCSAENVTVKRTNDANTTGENIRNEVIGRLLL